MPLVAPGTTVEGLGIMDIGQGNCNMLVDQNDEPICYFDIGYPLAFHRSSTPANMRYPLPAAPSGPILNNAAGNLHVVLSHWDYDHWKLGYKANLINVDWIVPVDYIGPTAMRFANQLHQTGHVRTTDLDPFNAGAYYIYHCSPNAAAAGTHSSVVNNTGFALRFDITLPIPGTANTGRYGILLTGDANFDSVNIATALNGLVGILAVHHGSNNHGAANNLPTPAWIHPGKVLFSYGLMASGSYAYNHPDPAVVGAGGAYDNDGWSYQLSTAEGPNIRSGNQANRGNIWVGVPTNLPTPIPNYAQTAFSIFPNT